MDRHHGVPVILGHLEQQVVASDASVVDQHMQPTQVFEHTGDRLIDRRSICHIATHADGLCRAQSGGGFLGLALVQVQDRDRSSLFGESGRNSGSDTACCSGDHCYSLIETTH
jgi:hypothetical protein